MARYDTYRTIARQENRIAQAHAARQQVSDAEDAAEAARSAYEDAIGTPAEDGLWTAKKAAEDVLYALDPKNSYFL